MFMDRHCTNVATSQLGFLTFLVLPLFQCASKLQQNAYWVRKVEKNLELWGELEKIERLEQAQKDADACTERTSPTIGPGEGDSSLNTNSLSSQTIEVALADALERGVAPSFQAHTPTKGLNSPGLRPDNGIGSPSYASTDPNSDLSPLHQPQRHGHGYSSVSSTSSAMSSGSGSITGRFSSFCKDGTVLRMFEKVRALEHTNQTPADDALIPHEHARFMSVDDESASRPESSAANHAPPGLERAESLPSVAFIAEEPVSPRHYTDANGSMPGTPMVAHGTRGPPPP